MTSTPTVRPDGDLALPTAAPPSGTGPVDRLGSRWIDHYDPEDPA